VFRGQKSSQNRLSAPSFAQSQATSAFVTTALALACAANRCRIEAFLTHDPALEAHEHAEHAEHAAHQQDPFISRVSITVAVLAVLAATAGSLETVEGSRAITESSSAVLAQDRATDAWNEYQADSLKRHLFEIAGEEGHDHAADIAQQRTQQDTARTQAQAGEKERDHALAESARHEERHHWLTGAATLVEIGIALSTVAIITRRRTFWLAALGLGATGMALFALAYLA